MTRRSDRPAQGTGRSRRQAATYLLILIAGAAVLALVLPKGRDITAAPQGPATSDVQGAATACLGPRLALVQSGVFTNFYVPGRAGGIPGDELGAAVAEGEIDRTSGTGTLHGTCAPGTAMAGQHLTWAATFERRDGRSALVQGPVLVAGSTLDATLDGASVASGPPAKPLDGNDLVARVFLSVAVVIAAARVVGGLFSRIRQPRVVGEIVAGILLGPSLLGVWWPDATRYLFPPDVTNVLRVMAQFGLILFMFIIGLELDHKLLRGSGHTAVLISHVSIVLPFSLGVAASLAIYPLVGSGRFTGFALFMGAAMAITAFPVLARILTDTGLHRTRLGSVAIVCAAVDDVTAWCVLAVVVAVVSSSGSADVVKTIGLAFVFVGTMFFAVRPLLRRLAVVYETRGTLNPPVLAGIMTGVFLAAWFTETIGIHAIFGAFVAGAIMPRSKPLAEQITSKLEDVTVLFLLPIFFAIVGLSTRFGLLDNARLWGLAAVIIAIAVIGKFGGSVVAARADGRGWRFSVGLGLLMNTRGLTEIVILTIGRSLGVISPALFTIMVLMALVTTFMATPLLAFFYPRRLIDVETQRHRATERLVDPGAGYRTVLVAVRNPAADDDLVALAASFRALDGRAAKVVLAHVVEPPGREEVRANLEGLRDAEAAARIALEPLARALDAAGVTHEIVTAVGDPGTEVPAMAVAADADLVLLGAHHPFVGQNPLGGVVADVVEDVACHVGVLVRAHGWAGGSGDIATWFTGGLSDLGVLAAATILAHGTSSSIRVVHAAPTTVPEIAGPSSSVPVLDLDRSSVVAAVEGARLVVIGRPDGRGSEVRGMLLEHAPGAVLVLETKRFVGPERPAPAARPKVEAHAPR